MAGICWNAPVDDAGKNVKRAVDCIMAEHGRVQEYVDVIMAISGISCRLGRELYTHIGGAPTRLQRCQPTRDPLPHPHQVLGAEWG